MEIDEIFKKRKSDANSSTSKDAVTPKQAQDTKETTSEVKQVPRKKENAGKKKRAKTQSSSEPAADMDDLFKDVRGSSRKKRQTDDGLPIIEAKDLKIGQGGSTDDCPFDCWCCY